MEVEAEAIWWLTRTFGNANQDEAATEIVEVICEGAQRVQHTLRGFHPRLSSSRSHSTISPLNNFPMLNGKGMDGG
jgi:hypothetical protein